MNDEPFGTLEWGYHAWETPLTVGRWKTAEPKVFP